MPIIQENSGTFHINLPKSIVTLKGWKKGTVIEFRERAGDVFLIDVR